MGFFFRYLYRRNKKGITAKLDDDLLKFYCNEDTFLMQVRKKGRKKTGRAWTLVFSGDRHWAGGGGGSGEYYVRHHALRTARVRRRRSEFFPMWLLPVVGLVYSSPSACQRFINQQLKLQSCYKTESYQWTYWGQFPYSPHWSAL